MEKEIEKNKAIHPEDPYKVYKNGMWYGKIGQPITSRELKHIVATTDDLFDVDFEEYQEDINKRHDDSITDINSVIPEEATPENQLADKNYVDSQVKEIDIACRGQFKNWESVPTAVTGYRVDEYGKQKPEHCDYIVIENAADYSEEELSGCWRFVYQGKWEEDGKNGWKPEYNIYTPITYSQIDNLFEDEEDDN